MTFRKMTLSMGMILGLLLCNVFAQELRVPRDAPRPQRFTTEDVMAGTGLPTWTGSFTHSGTTYTYVMVGTDPSKGSATTIVPVAIIPLKLTFSDGTVFDASGPLYHKKASATEAVVGSPIFKKVDYMAGDVDLGVSQFIDAFQRGNFWSSVSTVSPDYHVVLRPVVAPVQSFNVPASDGHTFPGPLPGTKRAILNGSYIDQNITGPLFKKFHRITPGVFTIFLTYNVFPAGAYGYHDVFGNSPATAKTYSYVSYLDPYTQLIDADISTLAHEVAEWIDDAYINNNTPCGLLEVGDPLSDVIFEIDEGGRVWHPQDLAFLGYFTFEPSQSVNGWLTFRNTFSQPCE